MKQITLTIEQMKHLESLGLDTSDASIYWHKMTMNARGKTDELEEPFLSFSNKQGLSIGMTRMEIIPAYTLQDILDKLPEIIDDEFRYHLEVRKYRIGYYYNDHWAMSFAIIDGNILEAAVQMLIWCIENNHIKINK